MPMKAPVIETTGTDLVPTSYICGMIDLKFLQRSQLGPRLAKVRPTKRKKSPKAARALVVRWPTCSMKPTGMAGIIAVRGDMTKPWLVSKRLIGALISPREHLPRRRANRILRQRELGTRRDV